MQKDGDMLKLGFGPERVVNVLLPETEGELQGVSLLQTAKPLAFS
jgi:hypothetical protein